jgi:hypothetical protein
MTIGRMQWSGEWPQARSNQFRPLLDMHNEKIGGSTTWPTTKILNCTRHLQLWIFLWCKFGQVPPISSNATCHIWKHIFVENTFNFVDLVAIRLQQECPPILCMYMVFDKRVICVCVCVKCKSHFFTHNAT